MTEIKIAIKDSLAQSLGVEYLQKYFSKQIELLELQQIADKIGKAMRKTKINWEEELEKARAHAWKEYKATLSKNK